MHCAEPELALAGVLGAGAINPWHATESGDGNSRARARSC